MNASALVHAACALTDPFCDAARLARWSDSSSVPSLPVQIRTYRPIVTDATGRAGIFFVPGYPYGLGDGTATAGGVLTAPANWVSVDISNTWGNVISDYRISSVGIRVHYTGAPLYASGMVTIATVPALTPGAAYTMTNPTIFQRYNMFPTHTIINKPVSVALQPDSHTVRSYYNNVNNDTVVGSVYEGVIVYLEGAPASTNAGRVEIVMNLEARVKAGSALSSIASVPPPFNPTVEDVARRTNSMMPAFFQGSAAAVEKAAQGVAARAITTLGNVAIGAGATALRSLISGNLATAAAGSALSIMDLD